MKLFPVQLLFGSRTTHQKGGACPPPSPGGAAVTSSPLLVGECHTRSNKTQRKERTCRGAESWGVRVSGAGNLKESCGVSEGMFSHLTLGATIAWHR